MAKAREGGPIVVLGSGMAGGVAVKPLREEGYGGRLVLIGPEPTLPFGRPPLSKTYLRGEEQLSGWLVNPPGWYAENDVELVAATAIRLDTAARRVGGASGGGVGRPTRPPTPRGPQRRPGGARGPPGGRPPADGG